ncbi:MAG: hypothetical protein RRY11_09895, partial [Terrisporobacter sp.]
MDKKLYFGEQGTVDDSEKLKKRVSSVKYATPIIQGQGNISTLEKSKMTVLIGGSEEMYNIEGLEMLYGRFYTQKDCLY